MILVFWLCACGSKIETMYSITAARLKNSLFISNLSASIIFISSRLLTNESSKFRLATISLKKRYPFALNVSLFIRSSSN